MNHKTKKNLRRTVAGALACALLLPGAAGVFAAGTATAKEEVIYAMADADGSVYSLYAVNIFGAGDVTDYGNYTAVKMLNTTDAIAQNGDAITFHTDAQRAYYQGQLATTTLPWNISLSYRLDGKAVRPQQLAGQSGHLVIYFTIAENPGYNGPDFYNNYALQASLTLDAGKCTGIAAEGATLANVGGSKQLSYTVLPGKGLAATIEADVVDFSMEGVSINAVPLALNIEVDTGALTDKTAALQDGVASLDTGAKDLQSAVTGELATGARDLNNGLATLTSGLNTLNGKSAELRGGAYQAFTALCSAAETQLNTQLAANGFATVTLTPETYAAVLQGLLNNLGGEAYTQIEAAVRSQVTDAARAEVQQRVAAQAEDIYLQAVLGQMDDAAKAAVYSAAAAQAVAAQYLAENPGASQEDANAYLAGEAGQAAIQAALEGMTDEQKQAALATAATQAVDALSAEQKDAILQGAVQQTMQTPAMQAKIESEVSAQMAENPEVLQKLADANTTVQALAALKAQLDRYNTFYAGLLAYTDGVAGAASGAQEAKTGSQKLYDAIAGDLAGGAGKLADGTAELQDKTQDIDVQIEDAVDEKISEITGSGEVPGSFISAKNTNVQSVQFVIKTAAIELPEAEAAIETTAESQGFWQKLLALFGK